MSGRELGPRGIAQGNPAGGGTAKVDFSVSVRQANLYQLALLPLVALSATFYLSIWGVGEIVDVIELVTDRPIRALWMNAVSVAIFVCGVVVHELIHGFSFALIGRQPLEKITLLGFQKETLTPYSHCDAPVEVGAYRWVVAMPGLLLGVLPSLLGIATGNLWMMLFGMLFTLAASGDALILWLSRKVERGKLVEDHPARVGFYVIDRELAR